MALKTIKTFTKGIRVQVNEGLQRTSRL